jgi:class 3 adenylate cyclase
VCPHCNAPPTPRGIGSAGSAGRLWPPPRVPLVRGRQPGRDSPSAASAGRPLDDGASTKASVPAFEERKLATVLFADVVGFTSFAERTDPEVVARIVDAAFRQLAEVVAEHGGNGGQVHG